MALDKKVNVTIEIWPTRVGKRPLSLVPSGPMVSHEKTPMVYVRYICHLVFTPARFLLTLPPQRLHTERDRKIRKPTRVGSVRFSLFHVVFFQLFLPDVRHTRLNAVKR